MDRHLIERLWTDKILVNNTADYLSRYDGFRFEGLEETLGKGALERLEFARLIVILEFKRIIARHGIRARNMLMYNGGAEGDPEMKFLPHDRVTAIDYDEKSGENDLHTVHLDALYDFVLFSQTIEHLYSPMKALMNLRRYIEPGGFLWTSLPTVNRQHSLPLNFVTGFTPIGLATLLAEAGFEVLEVGQWGNPKYINYVFRFERWPTYHEMKAGFGKGLGRRLHPRYVLGEALRDLVEDGTGNVFRTPVQCWILARKAPGES